jgi:hypothetical protein
MVFFVLLSVKARFHSSSSQFSFRFILTWQILNNHFQIKENDNLEMLISLVVEKYLRGGCYLCQGVLLVWDRQTMGHSWSNRTNLKNWYLSRSQTKIALNNGAYLSDPFILSLFIPICLFAMTSWKHCIEMTDQRIEVRSLNRFANTLRGCYRSLQLPLRNDLFVSVDKYWWISK